MIRVVSKSSAYVLGTDSALDLLKTYFTCTGACALTVPTANAAVGQAFGAIAGTSNAVITVVAAGSNVFVDRVGAAYTLVTFENVQGTEAVFTCIETGKWFVSYSDGVTLSTP